MPGFLLIDAHCYPIAQLTHIGLPSSTTCNQPSTFDSIRLLTTSFILNPAGSQTSRHIWWFSPQHGTGVRGTSSGQLHNSCFPF